MEPGKTIFIDVSDSTIKALKIVVLICLLLLCAQVVKAMYPNLSIGKRTKDFGSSNEKNSSDSEKRYWKKVAADIDKEFPESGKKNTSKKVSEKEKKLRSMVSDENIKIRKKTNPVVPTIIRDITKPKKNSGKKSNSKKKKDSKDDKNEGMQGEK